MIKGKKIRLWMLANNIRIKDVAEELGVHYTAISHFLRGTLSSKKIRTYFLNKGCPEAFLSKQEDKAA